MDNFSFSFSTFAMADIKKVDTRTVFTVNCVSGLIQDNPVTCTKTFTSGSGRRETVGNLQIWMRVSTENDILDVVNIM